MERLSNKIIKIVCIIAFVALIIILCIGNVIIIANQIQNATNIYCVYAFYALLIVLLVILIVVPAIRIVLMPTTMIPKVEKNMSNNTLINFAKQLGKYYPVKNENDKNEKKRFNKQIKDFGTINKKDLYIFLDKEIKRRLDMIDDKIKKYGKRVFILTAISQNSRFDTISVLILNFRMIYDLITSTGFRPGNYQLFKIYWRVMITGVFAYATSEVVEMADDEFLKDIGPEIGATVGLSFGKMLGRVFKSVADGAVNGLLTLRLGYITKKYLEEGFKTFENKTDRVRIYRESLKQALGVKGKIMRA